ncbi:hypothetical protein Acr_11g0011250 [Actinidia rufa]|uniref:Uncharacterized protein n=1 Tax=Actinidia rufa TaxID=165716 RepID=A0A7J0FF61_9ERIC|nr:hypothetical protein Acr_11g0011250 [Actinidia rufa]
MQSGGYKHIEENCPSLLCELLERVAATDDKSLQLNRKRSSSSIFGLDLAVDGAVADSADPPVRRMRRRL